MRDRILIRALVILAALAIATPASAVSVNGVEYVFLARSGVLMENAKDCDPLPANTLGCMMIFGNIGVSDPNGQLRIGAFNLIKGTATAHNVVFGTNAEVDTCRFDVSSGASPASVCGTIVSPLLLGTLPLVANWPPGPLGAVPVNNCVSQPGAVNVTVAAGTTVNLPPGCYRDVRINGGGILNLQASGQYVFRSLRMLSGSTLNGSGNNLNVQGQTITEAGVSISDLTISTPGTAGFSVAEFISIGNNSTLTAVVLYAPTSAIHLHTGMTGFNIEVVANFLTLEPLAALHGDVPPCTCFSGLAVQGTDVLLTGGRDLDIAQNTFLLSPDCNPANGVQVPATATTATTATLNVSGQTTSGRHVIVVNATGTFCSAQTLP